MKRVFYSDKGSERAKSLNFFFFFLQLFWHHPEELSPAKRTTLLADCPDTLVLLSEECCITSHQWFGIGRWAIPRGTWKSWNCQAKDLFSRKSRWYWQLEFGSTAEGLIIFVLRSAHAEGCRRGVCCVTLWSYGWPLDQAVFLNLLSSSVAGKCYQIALKTSASHGQSYGMSQLNRLLLFTMGNAVQNN